MAVTNAQLAKKLADALNDSRGHTQGRNPLRRATYSSGASFTVTLREVDENGAAIVKTVTVS